MASTYRPSPLKAFDLDLTIVSAKHLKNVNWKNGDLKSYAVFWVDPARRLATKSDDSGSTRPVWNERFSIPLVLPVHEYYLTLEIFHSKSSETPKPLVGTLRVGLKDLSDPEDYSRIRTFELIRPSGRPQGKIRIKLGVKERPLPPPPPQLQHDYHITPQQSYYYNTAPIPPPPSRDYRYSTASPPPPPVPHHQYPSYHHDTYSSPSPYYSGYYSAAAAPPPMPPRPLFERTNSNSYGGPSAPVDYSVGAASPYDNQSQSQRQKGVGGKLGFGTGLAVGAVAGTLGGLALEEGIKYEEDKIADRVEHDNVAGSHTRDDYSDYRVDY
ncbi:protein SRC2 [Mercurialis annua]|uniref:protein SRC2 n=1 Tax=Mercurialis annua TaxID=3986 RepID=UPI00215FA94E|nr:protein SRC2 [Mercurialis annua]